MTVNTAYCREGYDEPPPPSCWHRLNRLLWVLLIFTIVATIIGAFLPELQKQRNERDERVRLHRLIDEQRTLHSRHEREIVWLQNDPEYLAIFARERLDLMQEGETILRVDASKPPALTPSAPSAPAGDAASPMPRVRR